MSRRSVPPSINAVAFDCPHCGAYTTHTWHDLRANPLDGERRAPGVPSANAIEVLEADDKLPDDLKERLAEYLRRIARGLIFLDKSDGKYLQLTVINLHLSTCFSCEETAVWIHDRLLFPARSTPHVP